MESPAYTGDVSVIKSLATKRDRGAGHESIKPLLLLLGGGMRGAYGAGSAQALQAAGFGGVFSTVVGISTGAAIGAYFLGGPEQTRLGSSLYFEECASKEFIDLRRWQRKVDIDALLGWMRGQQKRLDIDAIKNNPADFFVLATRQNGHQEMLNAKTAKPDMLAAIQASMAIPALYGRWVTVNDASYADGGFDQPFPLAEVVQRFQPTDVVVIPNQSYNIAAGYHAHLSDAIVSLMAISQVGRRHAWSIWRRKARYRRVVHSVDSIAVTRVIVLWPPAKGLHDITTKARQLREACDQTRQKTLETLSETQSEN